MTKVALVNPGKEIRYAQQEPLSLGFIAGFLKKNGIEVRIIDEPTGQNVKTSLKDFSPDLVGITATTPLIYRAYEIAKICREMGILTVMGGIHVSVLPEEALKHADIVVIGEGEQAMLKIIKEGIKKGIVSCDYITDLDTVPPPARHLIDMNFYMYTKDRLPFTHLYFVPRHTRVASILSGRGCPYRCIFCHNSWRNTPYRFNSPERVISEIEELISAYNIKALFFIEDTLFVEKERFVKICSLIKKNKFKIIWGGNARVNEIDGEILKLAKDSGCRQITFGFESGSQRILDVLKKGTTVGQNKKAIQLCRKVGIIPQGTFIIGNPTETIEEIYATQRFIKENPVAGIGVLPATPFPGTKLWDWCQSQKLIPKDPDWSKFTFDHVVFPCSENLTCEQIEILIHQINEIADLKRHLSFSEFSNFYFIPLWKLPRRLIKAIKKPAYINDFIRHVKKLMA